MRCKMAYGLTVLFKTNENGSWEERPLQCVDILRGDFLEDAANPDTDYFRCYVERKDTVYEGYMDKDRIMRITKVYSPNKFQKEELSKSKKIKIDEVEARKSSIKDFINGKSGLDDLIKEASSAADAIEDSSKAEKEKK